LYTAYLTAAIVMTLSVLEGQIFFQAEPSLFKCGIFALVLFSLDLFLLPHVRFICAI